MHRLGHPRHRRHRGDAEPHAAAQRVALADALADLVREVEHAIGKRQQLAALGGEPQGAAAAREQRDAEMALELGEPRRDRGLRDMQMSRGRVEAAETRDPVKGLELAQRHRAARASITVGPSTPEISRISLLRIA